MSVKSFINQARIDAWLPPAIRYREWRIDRSWYIAAFVLLVMPWGIQLHDAVQLSPVAAQIVLWVKSYQQTTIGVSAGISAALGVVVFWYDFSQGRLAYALEAAVERKHIWRAKGVYITLAVSTAYIVTGVMIELAWLAAGRVGIAPGLIATSIYMILVHLVIAGSAMLVMSAIGNLLYAGLGVLLLIGWPSLVQSVVLMILANHSHAGRLLVTIGNLTAALSPASAISNHWAAHYVSNPFINATFGPVAEALIASWFVFWMVMVAWEGQRVFCRVRWERFFSAFYFPGLVNGVYAGLALITAMLVEAIEGPYPIGWTRFLLLMAMATPMFFFWRWLVRRVGQYSFWESRSRVNL